jgi:DNA-directed RNA polymerase beta subunit
MEKTKPIIRDSITLRWGVNSVEQIPIPHLLKINKSSYNKLLQRFQSSRNKNTHNLNSVFKDFFGELYAGCAVGTATYNIEECLVDGKTYSAPIYVYLKNGVNNRRVYRYTLGNIPLLTKNGSFIINGVENTTVNQLVRDDGLYIKENTHVKKGIKIRGAHGRSIEIDIIRQTFIGRKLNNKNRGDLKQYQDIRVLLDSIYASFKDVAYAYTYTTLGYIYNTSSWHFVYNWSTASKYTYTSKYDNHTFNAVYGKKIDNEEYRNILNLRINNLFVNSLYQLNKKSYTLIDIYNKNGKSIFTPDNKCLYPVHLLRQLLFYIGLPLSSKHITEEICVYFSCLSYKYALQFYFIDIDEKGDYHKLSIKHIIASKKSKYILYYNNPTAWLIKEDKLLSTYKECVLNTVGRTRLNVLLDTYDGGKYLTIKDIVCIIRYLIQLDNTFIVDQDIVEQDLYYKRLHSIGEQLYMFIREALIANSRVVNNQIINTYNTENRRSMHKVMQSIKALEHVVGYLGSSSLCQYTEQANMLSYMTHGRKISLMGHGGLRNDNVSVELRDVHISNYGRICPIETPEGKSVGIVTSLSIYTRVNHHGQLETPYLYVINGVVTSIVHYLTALEENIYYIALSNQSLTKSSCFLEKEYVHCRYNNKAQIIVSTMINYMEISTKQLVSVSSSLVPFIEHNDANRALMGANMQRQAVPLDYIEPAITATGLEKAVLRDINLLFPNDNSMYIINANADNASYVSKNEYHCYFVQCFKNSKYTAQVSMCLPVKNRLTNQKTAHNIRVKGLPDNAYVEGYGITQEELALGNNILVAFTSMNGHTFEDSIVLSERLIRNNYLQSTHMEIYKAAETFENAGQEAIIKIEDTPNVDKDGIILRGAWVKKEDILICKEKRQLYSPKLDKLIVSDKSVRYKSKKRGFVVDRLKLFEKYEQSNDQYVVKDNKNDLHHLIKKYTHTYLISVYPYILYISRGKNTKNNIEYKYLLQDLISNIPIRYIWSISYYIVCCNIHYIYNTTKYNNKLPLSITSKLVYLLLKHEQVLRDTGSPLDIIRQLTMYNPFLYIDGYITNDKNRNTDINHVLHVPMPLRKCKLHKYYSIKHMFLVHMLERWMFLLLHKVSVYIKNERYIFDNSYNPYIYETIYVKEKISLKEDYCLKMVKVIVASTHPIQSGDKLTGRYGNKGVVSRVVNIEDMPFLRDGTPIDVILSPLGVSSRMNIGQLFENNIGFISAELGKHIQRLLYISNNNTYASMRDYVLNLYRNKKEYLLIQNMEKAKLSMLLYRLAHSVGITSQAFNNIHTEDIFLLSRRMGLSSTNQVNLFDGTTGEPLDNKVTTGYLYIMKLNHLVDHKIHGRSIGPYNVITQQASKGKSRNGGQRLGEMEVWALQAYGAAYTLQEMLTFKSDSTVARTNFLQRFIKGKPYRIDIPRTFKLLRDELRVLGMDLNFIVKSHEYKR